MVKAWKTIIFIVFHCVVFHMSLHIGFLHIWQVKIQLSANIVLRCIGYTGLYVAWVYQISTSYTGLYVAWVYQISVEKYTGFDNL